MLGNDLRKCNASSRRRLDDRVCCINSSDMVTWRPLANEIDTVVILTLAATTEVKMHAH